jgi:hypothetical protein
MKSFDLKFEVEEVAEGFICRCIYFDGLSYEKELISQGRTVEESLQTMFLTINAKLHSDREKGRIPFLMK